MKHLAVMLILLSAADAMACTVCMGDPESAMMQGMSNGILFLLVIVTAVVAAFGAFFVNIKRRGEAALALESV